MAEIKCVICGKQFAGLLHISKYCGSDCRKEGAARLAKQRNTKPKPVKIAPEPIKGPTLTEIAKLARAAGMQYGDYVAKHGL